MTDLPLHEQSIRYVSLLNSYEKNSRTHSDAQINQVVESISQFGFTNPVLIDENNTIIAGHCRVIAAKKLNTLEVPCVVLHDLSEAQKRAYVIADNKLALNAGWDLNLLREEFELLRQDDFNLELTGFSLDELVDIFPEDNPEVFCDEDDCPPVPEEPKTKYGDVWSLGDHRLLCGDSTIQSDVDKLLDGQQPNTMITDPPYGVKYEADWRAKAKDLKKTEREKDKTAHPTQKPVELFMRSINHHTNPGEYVYDPFAGSGTLMVACEKSKRRALMMELDPKYCDVIINRWEKYTGKKAVLDGV